MKIRAINVSTEYKFEAHNVNANEDGQPKQTGDGRIYVSGQKVRYMLLETIRDLYKNQTISTADGVLCDITKDLRSDLIGYMDTENSSYANKRTSVVLTSFALSKKQSNFFEDLFVRFKVNPNTTNQNQQRINNKTYSEQDIINFNYMLDCVNLSTTEYFNFDEANKFVSRVYTKHVSEEERKKRAEMFLRGTSYLLGLANQSRNAVQNTPERVFICFSDKMKFVKFFELSEESQAKMLADLDSNNITYFLGGDGYEMSVDSAYSAAVEYLSTNELVDLSNEQLTHEEARNKYQVLDKKEKKSKKEDAATV